MNIMNSLTYMHMLSFFLSVTAQAQSSTASVLVHHRTRRPSNFWPAEVEWTLYRCVRLSHVELYRCVRLSHVEVTTTGASGFPMQGTYPIYLFISHVRNTLQVRQAFPVEHLVPLSFHIPVASTWTVNQICVHLSLMHHMQTSYIITYFPQT